MAQGQIFAYYLDGNLLWAHQEGGSKIGNYYNFNRPPVVREGLVMQRPQGHTLPARWRGYDAKTGEIRWEVPVGKSAWNYAAPIVLDLPSPDGVVVPVLVTPNGDSYDAATKTGKGPAFIRVRDGKVLGYLPGFNTQTGVQMTWHTLAADHPAAQGRRGAGILVCAPNADACKPTWAFRVWMSDAQTVASDVWWDDSSLSSTGSRRNRATRAVHEQAGADQARVFLQAWTKYARNLAPLLRDVHSWFSYCRI